MANLDHARRIASVLPGSAESPGDQFGFSVLNRGKHRGFVWQWRERVDPKRPRVLNPRVLAVRVANLFEKDAIIQAEGEKFFTEPHYNGYPAILVRLEAVESDELESLIVEAWRCMAPRALVAAFDAAQDRRR